MMRTWSVYNNVTGEFLYAEDAETADEVTGYVAKHLGIPPHELYAIPVEHEEGS